MKLHEVCNNFNVGLMSIRAFAESLGVPKSTVYSWKRTGDIPEDCFKKIGGSIFIRKNKISQWIEN